jgi:hypothetical protein
VRICKTAIDQTRESNFPKNFNKHLEYTKQTKNTFGGTHEFNAMRCILSSLTQPPNISLSPGKNKKQE